MSQAEPPFNPPSQPLDLDRELVDLVLPDMNGKSVRVQDHMKEVLVIDFWSAECPISRQYDPYFNGFMQSYGPKGVGFVAIDSNEYDDPALILHAIRDRGIKFPVLRDEGNRVADYFGAVTTPHVYVFDRNGRLQYRGAVDDITFKNKVMTISYLEEAVDALLLEREVATRRSEPYGCTINRVWTD